MIKKEIKDNLKSFIIWALIITILFSIVFVIYPSLAKDYKMFDDMMKLFPQDMLKMFNMDIINISTVSGWFLTEGYMMLTLLGGCYASMLGANILVKEENDKTSEFLYAMPISRKEILIKKILVGIFYITLFNLLILIINLIGFKYNNDFNINTWIYISVGSYFIDLIFFAISFFLGIFFKKTKSAIGVGLAISFGTYAFKILGDLSNKIEFFKYLSPYYYLDSRFIYIDSSFGVVKLLCLGLFILVLFISSITIYNKKEFI